MKAREGEPSGIASVPLAGMGLTSRRGGAEAAAAISRKALTFRTRDRNSSEDRPAWGEMPGWAGQAPTGGREDSHIGRFTCFLPLTSPLQEKTEAQRGAAKPAMGRVGWSQA